MLYEIAKPLAAALLRAVWRPRVTGEHHIPATGAVVLASNHLAYADSVILPSLTRRTVNFLGKSDIFRGGSPLAVLAARIMIGFHVLPVDRSGGTAASSAIGAGRGVLSRGEVLGIYPEGSRSPDGRLHRGKTGVARLALASGAPVVPVAMINAFEAQRGRRYLPRTRPRIEVRIGPALDLAALVPASAARSEAERMRVATDLVMDRIAELSGQDRVDAYAADVKRALRADRGPGRA